MVRVNKEAITGPLGLVKIATAMCGFLVACLPAKFAGGKYEHDRFNFMVTYGLLVFVWCLVSFMLYLFDVTSRFEPGTMRAVEIAVAAFLLLLGLQTAVYAVNTAVIESNESQRLEKMSNDDFLTTVCKDEKTHTSCSKEGKQGLVDEHKLKSNLNAATAAFAALTVFAMIGVILISRFCGTPGTQQFEPAHG